MKREKYSERKKERNAEKCWMIWMHAPIKMDTRGDPLVPIVAATNSICKQDYPSRGRKSMHTGACEAWGWSLGLDDTIPYHTMVVPWLGWYAMPRRPSWGNGGFYGLWGVWGWDPYLWGMSRAQRGLRARRPESLFTVTPVAEVLDLDRNPVTSNRDQIRHCWLYIYIR